MFERLKARYGESKGVVSHFLSHPSLSERIETARAAAPEDGAWTPILTDAQWADLQAICAG